MNLEYGDAGKVVADPLPSIVAAAHNNDEHPSTVSGLTTTLQQQRIPEAQLVQPLEMEYVSESRQQGTRRSSWWKNYVIGALFGALATLCFVLLYILKG